MLAINEPKLDGTISDTEVYIPGYITIRKDRSRSGGGVALYIRENLSYTNRIDVVSNTFKMICVEINLPHSRSFLVSTSLFWQILNLPASLQNKNTRIEISENFQSFLLLLVVSL